MVGSGEVMQLCVSKLEPDKPENLFSSCFAVTLPNVHRLGKRFTSRSCWKTVFITEDETALKIYLLNMDLGLFQEQMMFWVVSNCFLLLTALCVSVCTVLCWTGSAGSPDAVRLGVYPLVPFLSLYI